MKTSQNEGMRESNQNFNSTQGVKSAQQLVAMGPNFDIKMKTANMTNISSLAGKP
jgi:hypothetical protein